MQYDEAIRSLDKLAVEGDLAPADERFQLIFGRAGTDQALADALIEAERRDAQILALYVGDAYEMGTGDLDRWLGMMRDEPELIDFYVRRIVSRGPLALVKIDEWTRSPTDFIGQAGWTTLALHALSDEARPDSYYEALITTIASTIKSRGNWTRYAMNEALINIGLRSKPLRDAALAAAKKIGAIEVVDASGVSKPVADAADIIRAGWKADAKGGANGARPEKKP